MIRSAPARSWIIAGLAGIGGLLLWLVDNLGDDTGVKARGSWREDLVEACEFVVFVPVLAVGTFAIAETLRIRAQLLVEAQARGRQERLLALGVVAAGIAHEVRNPLHSLRLIVDELQVEGRLGDDHPRLRRHLERIDRAVALAYQLIGPANGSAAQRTDLALTVREALEEAVASGGPLPVDTDLPPVAAVAAGEGLGIIVANLLRNAAAAASGSGGRVQIGLTSITGDTTLVLRNPGTLPMTLDPTRPRSVDSADGLGLGLFICHQLAPGVGARLTITQAGPLVETRLTLPTWHGAPA